MAKIFLRKNIGSRVADGHPWIFANELDRVEGKPEDGAIVEVFGGNQKFIGRGYYNSRSQIIIRLLTRKKDEVIDDEFFLRRISHAWEYRKQIGYTENCRLIFGEADDLPQLIVDKFNDYFVIQTLALGIDRWKPAIVDALQKIFSPKGIMERNDVPVRELEGMKQQKGFLTDPFETEIEIRENDIRFHVDLLNGQKTGYFLDQQDNRKYISKLVQHADVLGAFCYTGTFELHAAHYGAKSVLGLDISENAIQMARRNAALNGLEKIASFECVNAFDLLKQWSKENRKWDVVMLDPPAFTKSREHITKAIAGYKEINLRGMKLVKPGGFLVTSSCTSLVSRELFLDTLRHAAKDARKKIRELCFQSQSPDHPIVWGLENTHYLKFAVLQIE